MATAKKSTQDLSRNMTETGASAERMRQKLEAATRALPKIKIDADSSPAEIKFAQLRAEMEKLASKKIGIDIDAAEATAEIQRIQRELEQLQRNEADINVRADIGEALSELRALDSEISRVDGRTANVNVDADVGGALSSIALVAAALASLPAVTSIAVGVSALGAAFASAGIGAAGFAAVAVPSLGRINEALKAQETAAKGAGAATGGAGQSAAQAAQQALQLEQAEKRLKDAQNEEKQAQEDLTRAREAGRRALEDMNFSLERSILSQKDAALAVREAEARLAEIQSKHAEGKASDLELERAMLSLEMAQQRAREQEVKTKRAREDTAVANKAGVKGTKEYQRAQEDLLQAQAKVAQAEAQLKMLHLQQKAAMQSAGGAAGGLKDAFADLSTHEKALAKDIKAFKDEYIAWQRSIQPDVLPAIGQGLDVIRTLLPEIAPMARGAGKAFTGLGVDAEKALRGPFWQDFFDDVNTEIPNAITRLGHTGGNVLQGFAGVIQALLPYGRDLLGNVEDLSEKFATWGTGLGEDSNFRQFMRYVEQNGPVVWETLKNVAISGGNIVQALAPFGVGALGGLSLLAKLTAGMDPRHIQGIALGVAAVYTAVKTGQTINAAVNTLDLLRRRIDDAGGAAGGARGKLAGFAGVLGAGGPWGAALGVGVAALGSFALSHQEAEQRIADMTTALKASKGVIDDEARALINNNLVKSGAAEAARKLGVDLSLLQEAAAGNPKAVAEFNEKLREFQTEAFASAGKLGTYRTGVKQLTGDALLLSEAVNGQNKEIAASRHEAALAAAMNANFGRSYDEAKAAIDRANGSLDASKAKTAEQRQAVELAREKFDQFKNVVKQGADAQATLTGKTDAAKEAVLRQLGPLFDLAGKNQKAREEVYKLAESYGISRKDADAAAKSTKLLNEQLARLKDKTIKITVKTEYQDELSRQALRDANKIKNSADGNIFMKAGGVVGSAAGPERHIAQIAPAGAWRVWAEPETGGEAYIPLAPSKRARSTAILEEVADRFGYGLVPGSAAMPRAAGPSGLQQSVRSQVFSGAMSSGVHSEPLRSSESLLSRLLRGSTLSLQRTSATLGDVADYLGDVSGGIVVAGSAVAGAIATASSAMPRTTLSAPGQIEPMGSSGSRPVVRAPQSNLRGTQPVNRSRVSRPQQVLSGTMYSGVASAPAGAESRTSQLLRGGGGRADGAAMVIEHYHEAPNSSARQTAEELNFISRRS